MNQTTRKSVLAQLETAQKGCRERMLTEAQVIAAIERGEQWVKKLRPRFRPLIRMEYIPWEVAKAYNHEAWGTVVYCLFNEKGEAVNAQAGRGRLRNSATDRMIVVGEDKYILENLGIAKDSEYAGEARSLLYAACGCNPSGIRNL